ncbi:hypothetical protein GGF31_006226 [Allomyces arbusculus]|nr:hypothetical protein GGF31_006226 [Allomyces arbusculus]
MKRAISSNLLLVALLLGLAGHHLALAATVIVDGKSLTNSFKQPIAHDGTMPKFAVAKGGNGIQFTPRDDSYFYTTLPCTDFSHDNSKGITFTMNAPAGSDMTIILETGKMPGCTDRDQRFSLGTAKYVKFTGKGAQTFTIPWSDFGLQFDKSRLWAVVFEGFSVMSAQYTLNAIEVKDGASTPTPTPTPTPSNPTTPTLPRTVERFADLSKWMDDSAEGAGAQNYWVSNNQVYFSVNPTSRERAKLLYTPRTFKEAGRHQWRVYLPMRDLHQITSVGAFLYANEYMEFDFEIGYGADDLREAAGAQPNEILAYMTTQATDGKSWDTRVTKEVAISGNAWHDLTMDLDLSTDGSRQFIVTWYIDGRQVMQSRQNWGPDQMQGGAFSNELSLENLWWMGAGENVPEWPDYNPNARAARVVFDRYVYTANTSGKPLGAPGPIDGAFPPTPANV